MRLTGTTARQSGGQGFTLIEILIATLIFAAILAALNSVFYGAFRLRASTSKMIEDTVVLNHAASLIKADLRNIIGPTQMITNPVSSTASGITTLGQGMGNNNQSWLQVYTANASTDNNRPGSDVEKVIYYLRRPDIPVPTVGQDLIRAVTRNLLPVTEEDITEQPILSGVEQLQFAFYDGTEWLDIWDGSTTQTPVPQAIRVWITMAGENSGRTRISRANTNDKPPLEIVVPIMVQGRTNTASQAATTGTTQAGGAQTGGGGGAGGGGGGNSGGGNAPVGGVRGGGRG